MDPLTLTTLALYFKDEWFDYFRDLFPPVTTADIDSFSSKYKHSDEEKADVLKAYTSAKGNFRVVMQTVMLAEKVAHSLSPTPTDDPHTNAHTRTHTHTHTAGGPRSLQKLD